MSVKEIAEHPFIRDLLNYQPRRVHARLLDVICYEAEAFDLITRDQFGSIQLTQRTRTRFLNYAFDQEIRAYAKKRENIFSSGRITLENALEQFCCLIHEEETLLASIYQHMGDIAVYIDAAQIHKTTFTMLLMVFANEAGITPAHCHIQHGPSAVVE